MEYRRLTIDDLAMVMAMNRDFREGFAEESGLRANVNPHFMGFPDGWEEHPLWKA